ncbi:metal ABC transporter solute-binding protein, Zn/Mn family [Agrilactobacillus yilanensis]|uniref:Metal ABC transporter solute-binding protein, Zn/Mn family n=1 Tax=Agrilactobacillus yilanensis TaxID=2485997 RepID=A0ABW4J960_9LACO|nr:zinc ABC transporter substrate-binding protein [Agrilactobacillus yilanensis]
MKKHYYLTIGALLLLLMTLLGTTQTVQASSQKIQVVTSLDFYGEAAKAVLKNKGSVKVIINKPSMDPHDFEPTTKTAKQIAKADFIIYNGLGYDGWMDSLLKATSDQKTTINVAKDIAKRKDGANEHVWYRPNTMIKLTEKLVKDFSKQSPKNAKFYKKNGQAYITKLKKVDKKLATLKANKTKSKVAVTEPVFNYMLAQMGYQVVDPEFAQAIEEGTDPTPKILNQLQEDIAKKKVEFLVVNRQTDSKIVTTIKETAKQYDVPLLYVTETLPANKTYTTWMLSQLKALDKIQQKAA